jgi:hypothetical protein
MHYRETCTVDAVHAALLTHCTVSLTLPVAVAVCVVQVAAEREQSLSSAKFHALALPETTFEQQDIKRPAPKPTTKAQEPSFMYVATAVYLLLTTMFLLCIPFFMISCFCVR